MKNGCLLNTENKHIQQDKPKAKYCFCMCYDYRMPFFIFYYCSERESYHNGIGKDTGGTVETQQNKEQKRRKKTEIYRGAQTTYISLLGKSVRYAVVYCRHLTERYEDSMHARSKHTQLASVFK